MGNSNDKRAETLFDAFASPDDRDHKGATTASVASIFREYKSDVPHQFAASCRGSDPKNKTVYTGAAKQEYGYGVLETCVVDGVNARFTCKLRDCIVYANHCSFDDSNNNNNIVIGDHNWVRGWGNLCVGAHNEMVGDGNGTFDPSLTVEQREAKRDEIMKDRLRIHRAWPVEAHDVYERTHIRMNAIVMNRLIYHVGAPARSDDMKSNNATLPDDAKPNNATATSSWRGKKQQQQQQKKALGGQTNKTPSSSSSSSSPTLPPTKKRRRVDNSTDKNQSTKNVTSRKHKKRKV